MESTNRVRIAGLVGIASGLLWCLATTIEHIFNLILPGPPFYVPNQLMFLTAQIGWVICILGLFWTHAAGDGWFGRIALSLFALAYTLLVIAEVVNLATDNRDFILYPIGGMLSFLAALLTGIAVAVFGRWNGWRRFVPLAYALYVIGALLLPLVLLNQGPSLLAEAIWGALWALMGLAVLTSRPARSAVPVAPQA